MNTESGNWICRERNARWNTGALTLNTWSEMEKNTEKHKSFFKCFLNIWSCRINFRMIKQCGQIIACPQLLKQGTNLYLWLEFGCLWVCIWLMDDSCLNIISKIISDLINFFGLHPVSSKASYSQTLLSLMEESKVLTEVFWCSDFFGNEMSCLFLQLR